MKALTAINTILFILCIPVLLITTDVRFAANSIQLYEYGFNKYDVSEKMELNQEELRDVARQLIDYFNSDEEFIDAEVFNERDVLHLKDVKSLIQLVYRLQFIALAYIIVFIVFNFILLRGALWRELSQRLIWGSRATIALLAIIGLMALVGFEDLFLWFHLVSFRNDLWQLYPGDPLLVMFPQDFFRDSALFIAAAAVAEAVVFWAISWGYLRLSEKRMVSKT